MLAEKKNGAKTALAKVPLAKKPTKLFHCMWRIGSTNGDNKSDYPLYCKVIGCSGTFSSMPPMFEERVLTCFRDAETKKSTRQILGDMDIKIDDGERVTNAVVLGRSLCINE